MKVSTIAAIKGSALTHSLKLVLSVAAASWLLTGCSSASDTNNSSNSSTAQESQETPAPPPPTGSPENPDQPATPDEPTAPDVPQNPGLPAEPPPARPPESSPVPPQFPDDPDAPPRPPAPPTPPVEPPPVVPPPTPPVEPPPVVPPPTPPVEPPPPVTPPPVTPPPPPPPPEKSYRKKELKVTVRAHTESDILFVVDNSGSMSQEQKGLAEKIDGFMNLIKDLDWRVGLTTTDPRPTTKDSANRNQPWGDGQLRPFFSDRQTSYVLRPDEQDLSVAQQLLATAIQVGIRGSGTERGINAAFRSIERSLNSNSPEAALFRPDSRLAVILISDEDECSNGRCATDPSSTSHPENLIRLVQERFGEQKVFQFHSIIFQPGDTSCKTGLNQGHTYAHLTALTGGIQGSVCDTDYTGILRDMGQRVVDLVNSANLSCRAADIDGDGKANILVTLADGTQISEGLRLEGTTLLFGRELPEGEHKVDYYCEE